MLTSFNRLMADYKRMPRFTGHPFSTKLINWNINVQNPFLHVPGTKIGMDHDKTVKFSDFCTKFCDSDNHLHCLFHGIYRDELITSMKIVTSGK